MNYALARDYYLKKQTSSLVSEATANELISLTLQHVLKNLDQYNATENKAKAVEFKMKALAGIYTLQSSLDFDKGGEIAKNLFRLYEFVKLSLLEKNDSQKYKVEQSLKLMTEILEAWREIKYCCA
jgi:flagellar protein FliS